jgi:hypothetical protein
VSTSDSVDAEYARTRIAATADEEKVWEDVVVFS